MARSPAGRLLLRRRTWRGLSDRARVRRNDRQYEDRYAPMFHRVRLLRL